VRLAGGLEDERAEGSLFRFRSSTDPPRPRASAGRSCGDGISSTSFVSSARTPYVRVAAPQKSGYSSPRSIACFSAWIASSRVIVSPSR
jgi:hypothetical protein